MQRASALAAAFDLLVRQAHHLAHDFQARATALGICMVLAWVIAPIAWLAASLGAFAVTEITQLLLYRRLVAGHRGWERPAFVANAGLAATVFCAFPMVIWLSGSVAGVVMGLGMVVTALILCVLVRSHHLGVCFATMAPLLGAGAWMVAPTMLDQSERGGTATPGALIAATLYCAICMLYLLHAAVEQNRKQRDMAKALMAAEAANVAKDRFLSSMSHEIRTPLNGILGVAQITRERAQGREDLELADTLLSSGHILKAMVDDILDHAKIEAGKMELTPEPTDLVALCRDVMRLFSASAEEKALEMIVDLDPAIPSLLAVDKLRLHQVLANLVSNAVKFTHQGHVGIRGSCRALPDDTLRLTLEVHDTGPGLSAADQATLFDAFTQAGNEAELAVKGTGLGLPIARSLAQLMGGDITLRSAPGHGACFTVTLRTRAVAATAPALPADAVGASPALEGLSVLVAEDNRANRLILRTFLKGSGVHLTEVENGALALEAARDRAFDLVLMDMRMPVMDGAAAFCKMRSDGIEVPVVALTANAMPQDRARYLQLGMDGYLPKPLCKTALYRTLHHVQATGVPPPG